ncbi:MAG: MBL fold metallo-hydrolase [Candidatus Pacebacteria bacterium]|nr:MBL fold metallo-hydrolase [Candidatus Paceibacterota bacterium]
MKITFYGGAGEVTGANYMLESGGVKILIDCGLAQGGYFSEKENWSPFKYNLKEIAAVFVTHAHIDHTGRLPKLIKDGYPNKVYSTPPTKDFAGMMLLDSEHLLINEAEQHGLSVMYDVRDVEELMAHWIVVPYHQQIDIGPFKITFYNAGHILGSSIILIEAEGKKIAFSGDLGNSPAPIIQEKEILEDADYCVIESAYGDRLHKEVQKGIIEDVIEDAVKNKGVLMIPAFAMERTQKLLFEINELVRNGRVPNTPVFLDSPLAIKLTDIYKRYQDYFDEETKELLRKNGGLFDVPGLKKTLTTEESKAINNVKPPKIIIAGSGMSQGGRILHHEKRYLPDPHSTILFVGYQTKNSLGRRILEGEKRVRIHGEDVSVRCHVVSADEYSAHADQKQLVGWIYPMRLTVKQVFVVQGEEGASAALAQKIINELAVKAVAPANGASYEL